MIGKVAMASGMSRRVREHIETLAGARGSVSARLVILTFSLRQATSNSLESVPQHAAHLLRSLISVAALLFLIRPVVDSNYALAAVPRMPSADSWFPICLHMPKRESVHRNPLAIMILLASRIAAVNRIV